MDIGLHMFGGGHAINDLLFEPGRIDFTVPINELEIWQFTNGTQTIHPMHVHGVQFQVLDRNGRPVRSAQLRTPRAVRSG